MGRLWQLAREAALQHDPRLQFADIINHKVYDIGNYVQ
jgi:hypothetical protein